MTNFYVKVGEGSTTATAAAILLSYVKHIKSYHFLTIYYLIPLSIKSW